MIQTTVLFQSEKEVTSNSYSLVCFIIPEILGILCILELSLVYVLSRFFLLINLNVVSSSNDFNSLIYVFRYKDIIILNQ